MRDVKFRVWDSLKERYVPCGEIIFSFYGSTAIKVVPNHMDYFGDEVHNHYDSNRFDIEQYIGRKDRNGAEMCEWDVVHYGTGKVCKVVFEKESASFGLVDLKDEVKKENMYWFGTDLSANECEVIGNIHEHLHLLNPE